MHSSVIWFDSLGNRSNYKNDMHLKTTGNWDEQTKSRRNFHTFYKTVGKWTYLQQDY